MNKDQMDKYAYELMVKNNPDEAVKNLLLKDKEIERLNKDLQTAIDICNNRQKEIIKLNNIINELEKHLLDYLEEWEECKEDNEFVSGRCLMVRDVLYDMHELKEGK